MAGNITKNFSWAEFTCKDGTPVPERYRPNTGKLAKNLQVLRDHISEPIRIISGYRSPSYNGGLRKQKGQKGKGVARNSQHMYGRAADIKARTHTPRQLHNIIEQLILRGNMAEGGLGLYGKWVHYDVRGYKARWTG